MSNMKWYITKQLNLIIAIIAFAIIFVASQSEILAQSNTAKEKLPIPTVTNSDAQITQPSELTSENSVQWLTDERVDAYDPSGPCTNPPCAPPNRWDGVFLRELFGASKPCGSIVAEAFSDISKEQGLTPSGQASDTRVAQFAINRQGYFELFYTYKKNDSSVELHLGLVSPPTYKGGRGSDVEPTYLASMFTRLRSAASQCKNIKNAEKCTKQCDANSVCIAGRCTKVDNCGDWYRIKRYVTDARTAKEQGIPEKCVAVPTGFE